MKYTLLYFGLTTCVELIGISSTWGCMLDDRVDVCDVFFCKRGLVSVIESIVLHRQLKITSQLSNQFIEVIVFRRESFFKICHNTILSKYTTILFMSNRSTLAVILSAAVNFLLCNTFHIFLHFFRIFLIVLKNP